MKLRDTKDILHAVFEAVQEVFKVEVSAAEKGHFLERICGDREEGLRFRISCGVEVLLDGRTVGNEIQVKIVLPLATTNGCVSAAKSWAELARELLSGGFRDKVTFYVTAETVGSIGLPKMIAKR